MCLSSRQGACGPHDTYGSALTAQPGWSQGRPDNNTSSQLIKYFGLPTSCAPDTPVPVSPGYSRRADDSTPPVVPKKSMPDNNIIEADHGALKRMIRPTCGFQQMRTASTTLKGFEVIRMVRRGHCLLRRVSVAGKVCLVNRLFGLAA